MKKIFSKIGQVLQLLLAAPVKLPGKVGNVLKYLALGLGIVETVLDEAKPQPEVDDKDASVEENGKKPASELESDNFTAEGGQENRFIKNETKDAVERSAMDETE
ncbi:hypothetical protein [Sphingobacterium multivorum]|uniref:hypothetical protein n=1 Tax=Sphingobacterium multivorum TaxID=28454 RepID=UPI000EB985E5|nr:hypothetical protein [Sphingobacterium multivorum]HAL54459.1 hypothetical protein [Sphingobacterium sp.]